MDQGDDHRAASPRPDGRARDHLANERTFLAWIRTAMGLIGMGFVLARMGLFLEQLAGVEIPGRHHEFHGSHEFLTTGIAFLLAGTALCAGSRWLHERARVAIDDGRYEPARGAVLALTVLVVAGGLTITGLVVWQLRSIG